MTAVVNVLPGGFFQVVIHRIAFEPWRAHISRPYRPMMIFFVRVFDGNETDAFISQCDPIVYFVPPASAVILDKAKLMILQNSDKARCDELIFRR